MESDLRREVENLFKEGKITLFLGYGKGRGKHEATPLFIRDAQDTERLFLGPFVVNNLTLFLPQLNKERIGILIKGCDSRSLITLLQDNKISREKITIVGMECEGLIDQGKLERLAGTDLESVENISGDNNSFKILTDKEYEFKKEEVLLDKCLACTERTPRLFDILIENKGKGQVSPILADEVTREIERLSKLSPQERWQFFKEEFKRCIRCYACKAICPACYCERCFAEMNMPQWVSPVPSWQENLFFQLIRVIHVAGRCSECGECERVCPAKIPLRIMLKMMNRWTEELYGFVAGKDMEASPLFAHFEKTDPEEFIR